MQASVGVAHVKTTARLAVENHQDTHLEQELHPVRHDRLVIAPAISACLCCTQAVAVASDGAQRVPASMTAVIAW
jgi:hypothetical protein